MSTTPLFPRLLYWLLPPLALLLLAFEGFRYHAYAQETKALACQQAQQDADAQRERFLQQEAQAAQQQREFALEVRGLGIVLDRFRQTRILDALNKAKSPFESIMLQDPESYPWSEMERSQNFDLRRGNAWEYALRGFVQRWPIPVILVAPPIADNPASPSARIQEQLSSIDQQAGLGITLYTTLEAAQTDRPEKFIVRLFEWFEQHPEMPAAVILVADGLPERDYLRSKNSPALIRDGYEVPKQFDAMTALLVARTDRVDAAIRPYVYEAPYKMSKDDGTGYENSPYATIKLWNFYFDSKEEYAKQHDGSRAMTNAFWQESVKTFIAQQDPDAGDTCATTPYWDKTKGFKPNPWVPVRWVKWQLEEYDEAPFLGYLHRPVYVPFHDAQGKPLSEAAKTQALAEGWKQALATLPAGDQHALPQRVFYDTGSETRRVVPLASALAQEFPQLNPMDAASGFNVSQRIGNTGITSPLTQIGLGLMQGYFKGGTSATIDLRHDDGAYLIMVRPPSEERKKANRLHPDPFAVKLMPQFSG